MGRPASTDGGRPVSIHLRLSAKEAAKVDAARGPLSRADFLRAMLDGTTLPRPVHVTAVDEPITEIFDADAGHNVAMVPAVKHRHRRGAIKSFTYNRGVKVNTYYCVEPGCMSELL